MRTATGRPRSRGTAGRWRKTPPRRPFRASPPTPANYVVQLPHQLHAGGAPRGSGQQAHPVRSRIRQLVAIRTSSGSTQQCRRPRPRLQQALLTFPSPPKASRWAARRSSSAPAARRRRCTSTSTRCRRRRFPCWSSTTTTRSTARPTCRRRRGSRDSRSSCWKPAAPTGSRAARSRRTRSPIRWARPTTTDGTVQCQRGSGIILTDANGVALDQEPVPGQVHDPHRSARSAPTGTRPRRSKAREGIDAWVKNNEPRVLPGIRPARAPRVHRLHEVRRPQGNRTAVRRPDRHGQHGHRPHRQHARLAPAGVHTSTTAPPVTECWVGLNEAATAAARCTPRPATRTAPSRIPNVPTGTYELVVWDEPLDMIIGVDDHHRRQHRQQALGDVPVSSWFGRYQGRVFQDIDGTGLPYFDDGVRSPVHLRRSGHRGGRRKATDTSLRVISSRRSAPALPTTSASATAASTSRPPPRTTARSPSPRCSRSSTGWSPKSTTPASRRPAPPSWSTTAGRSIRRATSSQAVGSSTRRTGPVRQQRPGARLRPVDPAQPATAGSR